MKKMSKKAFIVIFLSLFLLSCDSNALTRVKTFERMDKLEEPYEIVLESLSSLNVEKFYATHALVLNENQTIYYAPETYEYEDDLYINKMSGYYLYDKNDDGFLTDGYNEISEDEVKEILNKRG